MLGLKLNHVGKSGPSSVYERLVFLGDNRGAQFTFSREIYTTGKKYGILFISATFCIFVGGVGYFCIWNTFLQQILLLEELIST